MSKEKTSDKLDNLFEVALVLTGVLAAALFQYITALPSTGYDVFQEVIWKFTMGFTTFPFIVLILIWISKEVFQILGKRLLSLRLTFLCWSTWGILLFIYLVNVFDLIQTSNYLMVIAFFVGILPVILIAYGYKNAATDLEEMEYFKSSKWKREILLYVSLELTIMILFFYGFLYLLFSVN